MGVTFLRLPDEGVPWDGRLVELQLRIPCRVLVLQLGHMLVLLALHRGGLFLALGHLLLLGLILADHLPLLGHLLLPPFLLQVWHRE